MSSARECFAEAMSAELDENPRAALVLADISTALFRAAGRRHPDRVVNVGIREQAMIGVSAGMSLAGLRPVAHSYASFLVERPFEQVKVDLCHQGLGAVLVSIGASYDASEEGRTHQCPGDVALLDTLPGWTVHVPGHPDEVEGVLREALSATGPVYVRLSERSNRSPADGPFSVVRRASPSAPLLVAVGPLRDAALEAARGLDVTVLHLTTVRPLPVEVITSLAGGDVVVVEPYLKGTSAAGFSAALGSRPHRLACLGVGIQELRRYGTPEEHERAHGLDAAGIRRSLGEFL